MHCKFHSIEILPPSGAALVAIMSPSLRVVSHAGCPVKFLSVLLENEYNKINVVDGWTSNLDADTYLLAINSSG